MAQECPVAVFYTGGTELELPGASYLERRIHRFGRGDSMNAVQLELEERRQENDGLLTEVIQRAVSAWLVKELAKRCK